MKRSNDERSVLEFKNQVRKHRVKLHSNLFQGKDHDHGAFIENALKRAGALCRTRGARLIPLSRRVTDILREIHAPMGSCDIQMATPVLEINGRRPESGDD